MTGVEFLEPEPNSSADQPADRATDRAADHIVHRPADRSPEPGPPRRDRTEGRPASEPFRAALAGGAGLFLWLIAALLCVVASFRDVWTLGFKASSSFGTISVDGWGRYHNGTPLPGEHGTRLGVVLLAAAVLMLLAGVLQLRPGHLRTSMVGRLTGVGATVGLLAAVAVAYLEADATLDEYRARLRLEALDTSDSSPASGGVNLHTGSLVWIGLLGVLCGALALVLPTALRVVTERRTESDERIAAIPDPEHHPDDETLADDD